MRLIDADDVKYTRIRIFHGMNEDGTPCVGGWTAAILSCAIEDAPTVDAVPVVHGRWIKDGDVVVCSECGEEHAWDEYRATYCEDCGAKMDGGNEHG